MFRRTRTHIAQVGSEWEVAIKKGKNPSYFLYFPTKAEAEYFVEEIL